MMAAPADRVLALTEAQRQTVIGILERCVPGREIRVFGSRAGGAPKPFSDLDLVIMGTEALDLGTLAALREAFSASDLPWKVDLVDWATASPVFRTEIASRWVPLGAPQRA